MPPVSAWGVPLPLRVATPRRPRSIVALPPRMARGERAPLLPHQRSWPGARAGPVSRVSFSYLAPLFEANHPLRPEDLFELPEDLRADRNAKDAYAAWDARPSGRPATAGALARALVAGGAATTLIAAAPLKVIADTLTLVRPLIFERLVAWFAQPSGVRDIRLGIAYVAIMFLLSLVVDVLVKPQYMALCGNSGVRADRSLALLLQRKALRVDASSRGSSGKIVSLLSVDSKALEADVAQYLHMVWASPLQVLLGFFLLYRLLGPPALAGVFVMLLGSALAAFQCGLVDEFVENKLAWSDRRLRLISEVLTVIRQVKTAGLEAVFQRKVSALRNVQMKWTWRANVVDASGWALWDSLPVIVIAVTFGAVAVVSPQLLVPEKVFAALALLEVIRFPITYAPEVFQGLIQARVSLQRIADFLDLPEAEGHSEATDEAEYMRSAASLHGGTFYWGEQPVLRNPHVEIPRGALTLVTGPVGAGKSSLIAALLGEMSWKADTPGARRATVNADVISYAPQEPYIFDSTLRENVVYFSNPVDETWYARVIKACALDRDIAEMPDGDKTMLGSKGHQLSGGQKARVALARCVFLKADLYILDATLSALDTNVARHVYASVLGPKGLLAGKTRVVITHTPIQAEFHIRVSDGVLRAKSNGTNGFEPAGRPAKASEPSKDASGAPTRHQYESSAASRMVNDELSKLASSGTLGKSLRWYVFFSGVALPLVSCGLIFVSQAAMLGLDAFLSQWSNSIEAGSILASSQGQVVMLLTLCAIAASLQLVKQLVASFASLKVAADLHEDMLSALFRAKTRFFDSTPVGTLINRFAGDISAVDYNLPVYLIAAITTTTLLVLISVLTLGISPASCVVALPMTFLYITLSIRFCKVIREIQGLRSASESPLLSSFEESLDPSGIQVLRASRQTEKHLLKFNAKLDANTKAAMLTSNIANRYLDVRVAFYGACFIAGIGSACVAGAGWLSPGVVGLTLIWAFKLTSPLTWLPSLYGAVQTGLVSCDRIRSYLVSLPREAPLRMKRDVSLERENWPTNGRVAVKNAKLRYRPGLPLALKGINFVVPGGSSLGICGRTGAGKSSIMAALLRSTELESGSIEVDGVDISTVGLGLLRSKIAVLPQDPMLFRATVRENLDPEGLCSDAEIWMSVKRAQISKCVELLGGLDGVVEDSGQNLSPGERQLLALARILCRHNSAQGKAGFQVLLLDEASASLDYETDTKIQEVIRTWLKGCTMIVIAHRIRTIMSCDRVCVIDNGKVAEGPEAPEVLFRKKSSRFAKLASDLETL